MERLYQMVNVENSKELASVDEFVSERMSPCSGSDLCNGQNIEDNVYDDPNDSGDENNVMSSKSRPGAFDYFSKQSDISVEYKVDPNPNTIDFDDATLYDGCIPQPVIIEGYTDEQLLKKKLIQKKLDEEAMSQRVSISLRSENAHNLKVRLNNDQRSDEQFEIDSQEDYDNHTPIDYFYDRSEEDWGNYDGLENVKVREKKMPTLFGVKEKCKKDLQWGGNEDLHTKYPTFSTLDIRLESDDRHVKGSSQNANFNNSNNKSLNGDKDNKSSVDINAMELSDPNLNPYVNMRSFPSSNSTLLTHDTSSSKKLRKNTMNLQEQQLVVDTSLNNCVDKQRESIEMKSISHSSELLEPKNYNNIYSEEDKTSKFYLTKLRRDKKKNIKKNIKNEYIVPTNSDIVESVNPKKKNLKKSKKNKGKSETNENVNDNKIEDTEIVKKIQDEEKAIEDNIKLSKPIESKQKIKNKTVEIEKSKKELVKDQLTTSNKDKPKDIQKNKEDSLSKKKIETNIKMKDEDLIPKKGEIVNKKDDFKNKKKEQVKQTKELIPKTNPTSMTKPKPKDMLPNKEIKKETVQIVMNNSTECKDDADIPIEEINRQIAAMEDKELENEFETVSYGKKKEKKNQIFNNKSTPVNRKMVKTEVSQSYSKADSPQYNKNNDSVQPIRENNIKDSRKPYSHTLKHTSTSSNASYKPPICPITEYTFPALSNSQNTVVKSKEESVISNQNNADQVVDNYANRTKQQFKKRPIFDNKKPYTKTANPRKMNPPSTKDSPVYFDNSNSTGIYAKPLRSDISFGTSQPCVVKSTSLPSKPSKPTPIASPVSKPPVSPPISTNNSPSTTTPTKSVPAMSAPSKPTVKPGKPISYASKTAGKNKPNSPSSTPDCSTHNSRLSEPNVNVSTDDKQPAPRVTSAVPAKFVYCREKDPNFVSGKFNAIQAINLIYKEWKRISKLLSSSSKKVIRYTMN